MPSYKYESLYGNDRIRLLNLHPGKGDEPLFGSLFVKDRAGLPEYETISYFWGEKSITDEIETDDGTIEIHGNLQSALLHLRLEHSPRILWADQICINQDDKQEKECQISIMQEIYSASNCTLVFHGAETQSTLLGADFFLRIMNDLPKTILSMEKPEE
jgi:hypothetical protein